MFKKLLNKKLEEILNNKDYTNDILITLIFNVLKKSYYLLRKNKLISSRNNSFASQSYLQSDSEYLSLDMNVNHNCSYDSCIIEDSLILALKFLMIPKNNINNQYEKQEKIEEDKNAKILFLLSKNSNNISKNTLKDEKEKVRRDEISINCMNFIYKFTEEPIKYNNNYQKNKSVIMILINKIFFIALINFENFLIK